MLRAPQETFNNAAYQQDDYELIRNHLLRHCWHDRQNELVPKRRRLLQEEFQRGVSYGYMVAVPRLHHLFEAEDQEAMCVMAEEVRAFVDAVIFYGENDDLRKIYKINLEVWEGGWLKSPRSSGAIWYERRYGSWIGVSHFELAVSTHWEVERPKMVAAALKEIRDAVMKERLVATLIPAELYGRAFDRETREPAFWAAS